MLKALVMSHEDIQRQLPELTGRHKCINCLAEIGSEAYFENDFMCVACAEKAERYPLATTPHAPETDKEPAEEASPRTGTGAQR